MYPISDSVKETKRNLRERIGATRKSFEKPCQRNIHESRRCTYPYVAKERSSIREKVERNSKIFDNVFNKALEGSKRFPPFEKPCRSTIHGRKKFHVWLRKGRRRSFEKKVRTQRSTISYLRQRIEKGQEDFLLPFPFFEQSYWISRLQNVTKMFSIVGGLTMGIQGIP